MTASRATPTACACSTGSSLMRNRRRASGSRGKTRSRNGRSTTAPLRRCMSAARRRLAACRARPSESGGSAAMLDNATLRTHTLEGTRAFFEQVLGLKPGYRPKFSFPGYWLYAEGEPVIHLIPGEGGTVDRTGETIDHVGFRLTGYDAYRDKLYALHLPYSAK